MEEYFSCSYEKFNYDVCKQNTAMLINYDVVISIL